MSDKLKNPLDLPGSDIPIAEQILHHVSGHRKEFREFYQEWLPHKSNAKEAMEQISELSGLKPTISDHLGLLPTILSSLNAIKDSTIETRQQLIPAIANKNTMDLKAVYFLTGILLFVIASLCTLVIIDKVHSTGTPVEMHSGTNGVSIGR